MYTTVRSPVGQSLSCCLVVGPSGVSDQERRRNTRSSFSSDSGRQRGRETPMSGKPDTGMSRPSWTSSPMVSVRFDSRPTADERPNAERRFRGKEVHLWSPRASPRDRETWVEEVDEAMRTSQPKIPRWILEGPPTKEEINKLHKEATSEVRATKYSEALHEYQEWNTIFWDMIEPTLDFSGAYACLLYTSPSPRD